jgi:hypothetical protein
VCRYVEQKAIPKEIETYTEDDLFYLSCGFTPSAAYPDKTPLLVTEGPSLARDVPPSGTGGASSAVSRDEGNDTVVEDRSDVVISTFDRGSNVEITTFNPMTTSSITGSFPDDTTGKFELVSSDDLGIPGRIIKTYNREICYLTTRNSYPKLVQSPNFRRVTRTHTLMRMESREERK